MASMSMSKIATFTFLYKETCFHDFMDSAGFQVQNIKICN